MDKWKKTEEKFISVSGVDPVAYGKINSMLSSISKRKEQGEDIAISFAPIKDRIRRLRFWKKIRYTSFGVMAYAVIFNLFFLKDIVEWTDLSRSLNYFFVFIASKWLEYMGEFAYKSFSAVTAMMSSYWILVPLGLLMTAPLLIYRLRRSQR